MSAMEKSDLPEVAKKRANRAASAAAEAVQRRGRAKENAICKTRSGLRARQPCQDRRPACEKAVTRNKQAKLTALLHHINIDIFQASFFGLKRTAVPGIDEMTWTDYAKDLESNRADLHHRVHTGAYRARCRAGSTYRRRTADSGRFMRQSSLGSATDSGRHGRH